LPLVFIPAAWLLGTLCFRVWGREPETPLLVRLLCGVGLLAVPLTAAGAFRLDIALLLALAVAIAGAARALYRPKRLADWLLTDDEPGDEPDWITVACMGAVAVSLLLAFVASLAPVTSWDATVAHIALPADYSQAGRIYLETGNVYSGYPHLMHTLWAVAYHGGGEHSVTLLNWLLAGAACWALYGLGAEVGSRRVGWAAAAMLACAPVFADQAGAVGIDLPFVAFSTGGLWMAARWGRSGAWSDLMAAGLLLGLSCGIRHTGFLSTGLVALGLPLLGSGRLRWQGPLVLALAACAAACPWLLRSALYTGNPVYPFFFEWFASRSMEHIPLAGVGLHETTDQLGGGSLLKWLRFPWDIVMRPQDFDGWTKSPGGLVLILGVPGLLAGGRAAWMLGAYSMAGGTAFFLFQRLARYMLPFFAASMVIAALSLDRVHRLRWMIRGVLLAGLAYGLVLHAAAMHFKAPVALGLQSREEYLLQRVERYEMFQYANEHLSDGIVFTPDQRTYYLHPRGFQNHWAMEAIAERYPNEQHDWLVAQGIRYLLYPQDYVKESGNIREPLQALRANWSAYQNYYRLVERLRIANPRSGDTEIVEVYEVLP